MCELSVYFTGYEQINMIWQKTKNKNVSKHGLLLNCRISLSMSFLHFSFCLFRTHYLLLFSSYRPNHKQGPCASRLQSMCSREIHQISLISVAACLLVAWVENNSFSTERSDSKFDRARWPRLDPQTNGK